MELVLRNSLRQNSRDLSQVVKLIVNDEKVLFAWAIASMNWQEDSANILLNVCRTLGFNARSFTCKSTNGKIQAEVKETGPEI